MYEEIFCLEIFTSDNDIVFRNVKKHDKKLKGETL